MEFDSPDLLASCNRVLFVDDEEGVLEALGHATFDEDFEVYTASSGPEALELLATTPVALVVSDHRMPRMTGVEFLRAVCDKHPRTVRMILSGYAEAHAVVAAINEGHVHKFIGKPWKDDELLDHIRSGMEKYKLALENELLQEKVRAQNKALQDVNDSLERKVQERTARLEARNRALSFAHEVLNQLPYALFGVDRDRRLAVTNVAASRFSTGKIPAFLGEAVGPWMPEPARAAVESVLETGAVLSTSFEADGKTVEVECVPLGDRASRGAILIMREAR